MSRRTLSCDHRGSYCETLNHLEDDKTKNLEKIRVGGPATTDKTNDNN